MDLNIQKMINHPPSPEKMMTSTRGKLFKNLRTNKLQSSKKNLQFEKCMT